MFVSELVVNVIAGPVAVPTAMIVLVVERKYDGFFPCHVPSQLPVVVATYAVDEVR